MPDFDVTPEQIASIFKQEATETPAPDAGQVVASEPQLQQAPVEPPKAPEPPPLTQADLDRELRAQRARDHEIKLARQRDQLRKERQEVQSQRERLEKIKTNPIEALKEAGLDPKEFLERVISDGKPTLEYQIQDLQKQLEQERSWRENYEATQARAQGERVLYQAMDEFVDLVAAAPEKYPTLVDEYTPDEIGKHAYALGLELQRTGQEMTDDEIAARLEHIAAQRAATKRTWRDKVRGSRQPVQAPGVSPAGTVSRPDAPRTLSNEMASERASAPKAWSQEDADAESLRILQAAMKNL